MARRSSLRRRGSQPSSRHLKGRSSRSSQHLKGRNSKTRSGGRARGPTPQGRGRSARTPLAGTPRRYGRSGAPPRDLQAQDARHQLLARRAIAGLPLGAPLLRVFGVRKSLRGLLVEAPLLRLFEVRKSLRGFLVEAPLLRLFGVRKSLRGFLEAAAWLARARGAPTDWPRYQEWLEALARPQ